jgi:hypothetical protein
VEGGGGGQVVTLVKSRLGSLVEAAAAELARVHGWHDMFVKFKHESISARHCAGRAMLYHFCLLRVICYAAYDATPLRQARARLAGAPAEGAHRRGRCFHHAFTHLWSSLAGPTADGETPNHAHDDLRNLVVL